MLGCTTLQLSIGATAQGALVESKLFESTFQWKRNHLNWKLVQKVIEKIINHVKVDNALFYLVTLTFIQLGDS